MGRLGKDDSVRVTLDQDRAQMLNAISRLKGWSGGRRRGRRLNVVAGPAPRCGMAAGCAVRPQLL